LRGVSKTFRPYAPRQAFLLPPSPLEWLPQDHLALFILDIVQELDLSPIYAHYERELRGFPPHDPQMMVALLLYGYCVGVPSSRKIERKTHEDVAFRVIAGGGHPDHSRISDFRRVHLEALAGLFVEVLCLCQKAGLVKLGSVALDGTKVKANASKHKAMSYERMKKDDQKLREKVSELLAKAEQVDEEEDAVYGKGRSGDELPEDLRHAKGRGERIRQLMKELEEETKRQQEAETAAKDNDEPPPPPTGDDLPSHKIPRTTDGKPTPKAQRNFTDPESRIMKSGDGFVQGYNCQAAVDAEHQIIVAQAVTNQPPDVEHLIPMVEKVVQNCEAIPEKWSADAGYFSEQNVVEIVKWKIDPYIATGRRKHDEPPPSVHGRPSASLTIRQRMARKLATRRGAAVYARRKVIPEPVFGQIKEARGFRRFLLRGIVKVRGEWSLVALTHNLLKLHAAMG
jgi:transposase